MLSATVGRVAQNTMRRSVLKLLNFLPKGPGQHGAGATCAAEMSEGLPRLTGRNSSPFAFIHSGPTAPVTPGPKVGAIPSSPAAPHPSLRAVKSPASIGAKPAAPGASWSRPSNPNFALTSASLEAPANTVGTTGLTPSEIRSNLAKAPLLIKATIISPMVWHPFMVASAMNATWDILYAHFTMLWLNVSRICWAVGEKGFFELIGPYGAYKASATYLVPLLHLAKSREPWIPSVRAFYGGLFMAMAIWGGPYLLMEDPQITHLKRQLAEQAKTAS